MADSGFDCEALHPVEAASTGLYPCEAAPNPPRAAARSNARSDPVGRKPSQPTTRSLTARNVTTALEARAVSSLPRAPASRLPSSAPPPANSSCQLAEEI